jgi:hypothetical protein
MVKKLAPRFSSQCQFKSFWVDSVAAPLRVSIPYNPVRRTAVRITAPSLRRFNPTN